MDADKKRLWVSGQFIEVTDEVYDAYMKGDRKMRYFESDLKTERFLMDENGQIRQVIPSREDSLDRLMDDNAEQFADRHESVEDMVLRRISIERLYKALDSPIQNWGKRDLRCSLSFRSAPNIAKEKHTPA